MNFAINRFAIKWSLLIKIYCWRTSKTRFHCRQNNTKYSGW